MNAVGALSEGRVHVAMWTVLYYMLRWVDTGQ